MSGCLRIFDLLRRPSPLPRVLRVELSRSLERVHNAASISVAGQLPRVVQLGHHIAHERLGQRQRALRIAEMVGQQRQRQLPRTIAFIGPFKSHAAEPLDVVARIEQCAIHRDHRAVQAAASRIDLHANITTLRTVSPRFNAAKPSLIASSGMRAEIISSSFSRPSR